MYRVIISKSGVAHRVKTNEWHGELIALRRVDDGLVASFRFVLEASDKPDQISIA